MKLKDGKNEYSDGTSSCDQHGCLYCTDSGRCIYHIAVLKQPRSRACYPNIMESLIELKHDYEEGMGF